MYHVSASAGLMVMGSGLLTVIQTEADHISNMVADVRLDQSTFADKSPIQRIMNTVREVLWDTTRARAGTLGSAGFRRSGYLTFSPGGPSLVLDGPFEIEIWAWIAHRANETFLGTVFVLNTHEDGIMVNYSNSSDRDSAVWINGQPIVYRTGASAWPRDRWVQFLIVRDAANRLVITVDGVKNLDITYQGVINSNINAALYVGASPHNLAELLHGNVAAISIRRR